MTNTAGEATEVVRKETKFGRVHGKEKEKKQNKKWLLTLKASTAVTNQDPRPYRHPCRAVQQRRHVGAPKSGAPARRRAEAPAPGQKGAGKCREHM
jgi:hypothetical protein